MWIGFGVLLLLKKIIENKNNIKKILLFVSIILFFIYWQSIIAARMPFITTIIFLIVYLLKNNSKIMIYFIILVSGILFFVPRNDAFKKRVERIKNYELNFPKGEYSTNWQNISTEQVRNGIYYCSYIKIKQSPIYGYGVGDADDQLQECYNCKFTDTDTYKMFRYNSHNQFLDFILVSGILGITFIMFFQFKILNFAMKSKNKFYLFFIFYFLINNTFENILNRQDGVMFLSFFNAILFFKLNNKNEKSINS